MLGKRGLKGNRIMKGICFLINNEYDRYIYKILKGISSKENIWFVEETDVWKKDSKPLFDKNVYSNNEFFDIIKEQYYVIFCNVKLYKHVSDISAIETVDDFLKCNCELILLVTDNVYVEVYSKCEEYLNIIKDNLANLGISLEQKDIQTRRTMYAQGD